MRLRCSEEWGFATDPLREGRLRGDEPASERHASSDAEFERASAPGEDDASARPDSAPLGGNAASWATGAFRAGAGSFVSAAATDPRAVFSFSDFFLRDFAAACGQATLPQPPRHWRHRPPGQTNQLVQEVLLRTAKRADARKGVHGDRSIETWPFLLQPFLKIHCEPHAEPSSDSTSLCETCHPSSPCSSVSSTRTVRGFCLSIESSSASFKCAR